MYACLPQSKSEASGDSTEQNMSPEATGTSIEPQEATVSLPSSDQAPVTELDPDQTKETGASSSQLHMPSFDHGPKFKTISAEEKSFLLKLHQNLGHPHGQKLCSMLRQQGYSPRLCQAAMDLSCSVCQNTKEPKHQRPSTIKRELDFNDCIGIDGVVYTNLAGTNFHFYHIIDYGTNYQVACASPGKSSDDAIDKVLNGWLQWAGAPIEIHTDSGTEFTSKEFVTFLGQFNIKAIVTPPGAHWQIGKVERHGGILQEMLKKYEQEHPITSYTNLQTALSHCTSAKNALSQKQGYSPETLVFGKGSRIPASISSDEQLPSHLLADDDTQEGIRFREKLAYREAARRAFHCADNSSALRRAVLRRSCPHRGSYDRGTWVMLWRQTPTQRGWFGPARVIQQEGPHCLWCNHAGSLVKIAPEHVRPVSAMEAQHIPRALSPIAGIEGEDTQNANIREQAPATPPESQEDSNIIPQHVGTGNTSNSSEVQPDQEPSIPESQVSPASRQSIELPSDPGGHQDAASVPVPSEASDLSDELVCDSLLSVEDQVNWCQTQIDSEAVGWKAEFLFPQETMMKWDENSPATDLIMMTTTTKRDRTEVKMHQLSTEEQALFRQAKEKEITNWLNTGTVSKIFRDQLCPEQVMRCRWICVWKPLDADDLQTGSTENVRPGPKTHKPKARLVVLGYQDPQLDSIPRDSPTLGKQSKMLLLQAISSMGWTLKSFDIKAAFLQGKTQEDRVLGLEPVEELRKALKLQPNQICKLEKSAYGLIDAPYLWHKELDRTLRDLNFIPAPFDPCAYVLYKPGQSKISGVLGVHVDDGLGGGDQYFEEQISKLEAKFPFGSKKVGQFTFTGVEMNQQADKSIIMSQSKYVSKIEPIHMNASRRTCLTDEVTSEERHSLRALVGSLQYASINTRPDLSSRLSYIQSEINKATVQTLHDANRVLHEAKRYKDTCIRIQPIPIKDLRFLLFSDASFASAKSPESHTGMIILATHRDISENYQCPVSPLSWGCRKIQKVVTSTLSAETTSLQTSLDQLSWMRLYWAWIQNPQVNWKRPHEVFKSEPKPIQSTTALAQCLPRSVAVTDCKSLYDLVTRTAQPNCQEFRTQLQAKAIKDLLSEGIQLRWVHTGAQLADALTKVMQGTFLRYTLQRGMYQLNDELQVLKERADSRTRLRWLESGIPLMGDQQQEG